MRHITIPGSVKVKGVDAKGVISEIELSFTTLLEQFVWPNKIWRDGKIDNVRAFFTLTEKFKDTKAGDVVSMDDATYELFAPIATLRGENLRPEVAQDMMKLMAAVIEATSTMPIKEVKPEVSDQN